jgi:hypothetical protein
MLSMISIPVTALAVGLPAQRAIAQRFSAVAHLGSLAMSGFAPLLEDKRTSNLAKPGASVYETHPTMQLSLQYLAFPGVRGNGIASRTFASPVT